MSSSAILDKEHGDITYLKQDEIGLVLSKALSETYKAQPNDPVDFFAKYLLNHAKTAKKAREEKEAEKGVKDAREKHLGVLKQKALIETEKQRLQRLNEEKVTQFYEGLQAEGTEDLRDKLDELAQFLQEFTGPATGVYIGKLERPRKPISDADDDKAHVDREGAKLVRFHYTSHGHEFMKGKLLRADQGITHQVFGAAAAEPAEGEEPPAEEGGEEGEGGAKAAKVVADPGDILNSFKHVFVKEVVREPRIHFYRVPRLGSFMVVPLQYDSCLSAAALDAAVADFQQLKVARDAQEKERLEWEEEQNKLREEKEKAGDPWEPERRVWEPLEEKPFQAKKKSYVVCLDTLGQDREFSDDQRRFVLQTILKFKQLWEAKERECLRRDRQRRVEQLDKERDVAEAGETARANEEEDKNIEEQLSARDTDQSFVDEDSRELQAKHFKIAALAGAFKAKEDWKKGLFGLREQTVLKQPRILQSVFYLLQYKREEVCQEGTNKFFWKRAKRLIDESFIERLTGYSALGVKTASQAPYTTLNFLERNLEGIAPEEVEGQCGMYVARLFKWLKLCIDTRKHDITYRKGLRRRAILSRDTLIQKEKERQARMEVDVAEAEGKFAEEHKDEIEAALKWETEQQTQANGDDYGEEGDDEDGGKGDESERKPKEKPPVPEFNREEFLKRWLEDNPVIEIPSDSEPEADSDWILTEEEEQGIINAFLKGKVDDS